MTTHSRHAVHPGRTRSVPGRVLLAAGLLLAMAAVAGAAETQWWIADQPDDYARGESQGIAVRPDGTIELGPAAASSRADSLTTVWSIAVLRDGSVALAGDRGRIDRWTESGGVRPWVRLPVGQVLCLTADGDGLLAGTGPEGLVYRIGPRADTALVARTGERYVWALAPAGPRAWYAATGTRGRLMRIEAGRVRIALDTDESNLVSMITDGAGGAYAGGDSKGRVFHLRSDGSTRTVFDASEDEVRALTLGADGALYAAALSGSAVSPTPDSDESTEAPAPVKSAVSGGRATVYRIVPDSVTSSYWVSPQPFVYALAATPGGVLAATGNRAAVFRLERANGATQWLAAPQGQVTSLAVGPGGRVFAATSNPGALWRLGPEHAARGELLSPALDARRIARFGRLRWQGDPGGARLELWARSGNTDPADSTWSPWRGGNAGEDGVRPGVPPGRYLQWKLILAGGEPHLGSVEASWREQNLPPRLDELVIGPQGQDFREGELTLRSEPVTQTLPGGQKVEYSLTQPPAATSIRELPVWVHGLRTLQWKASDPNGDPLRFRVDIRHEGGEEWTKLGDDLEAPTWSFDTQALPDGRYRVRVSATDRPGNSLGEERTAELVSAPFTVDNTPPVLTQIEARADRTSIHVEARAEDTSSTLSGMDVSIDDQDWRPVSPVGGFTDEKTLAIQADLRDVKPGDHTVGVRAVDAAGNSARRAVRVRVATPR